MHLDAGRPNKFHTLKAPGRGRADPYPYPFGVAHCLRLERARLVLIERTASAIDILFTDLSHSACIPTFTKSLDQRFRPTAVRVLDTSNRH